MAASYPTSIKTFTTVVDGVDYPKAADITAMQEEIVAVETALRINAKGVYHSDTAPASPVTDQLWWETDTNILWTYGTYAGASRWVTATRFTAVGGNQVGAITASQIVMAVAFATVAGYDIYMDTLYFKHHVVTTNDGTKYWGVTLRKVTTTTVPASGAGTSLGTCNSSASSAGTWTEVSASIDAVLDGTGSGLEFPFFDIIKTSTAGDLWYAAGVTYRLVHP